MKVKFLGTAAAEGWPALFCECDSCMRAQRLGGKNIRTRPSCLIDEKYMIDFCADTYMHKLMYNLKLHAVEHVLITHSHSDHFYPNDFEMRMEVFAHIRNKKLMTIYGNEAVKARYDAAVRNMGIKGSVVYEPVEPYRYFQAGEARVMPLLANHNPAEKCYIYIIELGGRVLLYGHDSGYFGEETWVEISKHRFDGVILDCTFGPKYCREGHMGIEADREVKERMLSLHAADSKTRFIITHFSHNMNVLHDEMEELARPHNFTVAYDGMETDI